MVIASVGTQKKSILPFTGLSYACVFIPALMLSRFWGRDVLEEGSGMGGKREMARNYFFSFPLLSSVPTEF